MGFEHPGIRSTPWACGHAGTVWYANLHAEFDDPAAIEQAKRIVDEVVPQKLSTFHGTHCYSFVTREYLLNLLLFHHKDYGHFPVGPVCIVSREEMDGIHHPQRSRWRNWFSWMWSIREEEFEDPSWVYIPSLSSLLNEPTTA